MGRTHMRALSKSDRVRVVAVAEPSEASRAALDGDVIVYPDVTSLLRAGNIDGVLVAAPSTLHLQLVSQLAAAGVSYLVRKALRHLGFPGAGSGGNCQPARRQAAGCLLAAFCSVATAPCGNASSRATWAHCISWPATNGTANRRQPRFRANSGGIFVDMGVHEFDQIRWLSGQEFTQITPSRLSTLGPIHRSPAMLIVRRSCAGCPAGSTALVSLGRRFRLGDVCCVEAFGTRDAEDCRFLWPPDGEAAFLQALQFQAEGFADWVRGGEPSAPPPRMPLQLLRRPSKHHAALHR